MDHAFDDEKIEEIVRIREEALEDRIERRHIRTALSHMSYSEVSALKGLLGAKKETELKLVIKDEADRMRLTRSVVINALKKLECAGAVEVMSMGQSGTVIRVTDRRVFDELGEAYV